MITNRYAAFGLLVLQLYLVGEYAGEWGFLIVVGLLAVLSIFISVPLGWKSFVALGLLSMLGCGATVMMAPPQVDGDWVLPARYVILVCRVLIGWQVLEFLKARKSSISFRFAAFAMAGLLTSFCRYETPNKSLIFFSVAVISTLLLAFLWIPEQNWASKSTAPRNWSLFSNLISVVVLTVVLAMGTIYLANGVKFASGFLRFIFMSEYVQAQQSNSVARIAYSATGNLDSVTRFQRVDPNRIALRATCDVAPGYVRGRVFSQLKTNGWKTKAIDFRSQSLPRLTSSPVTIQEEYDSFSRGLTEGVNGPFRNVYIRHAPSHIGNIVFTPLNFNILACRGGPVICDEHDVVKQGVEVRQAYNSMVAADQPAVTLDTTYKKQLLKVPSSIKNRVLPMSKSVAGPGSDAEKIAAIESHFRTNYTYSLESFDAPTLDRISYFMLYKPAAHCEYFATAAAVMLRLNGIPARYVTGFIIDEYDDIDAQDRKEWTARNIDAHAWIEAYDRDERKWVVVEATPGVDVPKELWRDDTGAPRIVTLPEPKAEQRRSGFQSWFSYLQFLFQNYAQQGFNAVISVLLICLLYWLYRKEGSASIRSDYQLKEYARQMTELEKRLRKIQLERGRGETLHQFASRVAAYATNEIPEGGEDIPGDKQQSWVQEAAEFILMYAELRYSLAA